MATPGERRRRALRQDPGGLPVGPGRPGGRIGTMDDISDEQLADLLMEAGRHHHAAFITSDGVDAEWPLFYAAYLQTKLWDRLGILLTRSEIVHVLVAADEAFRTGEEQGAWPPVYARRLRSFAASKAARNA